MPPAWQRAMAKANFESVMVGVSCGHMHVLNHATAMYPELAAVLLCEQWDHITAHTGRHILVDMELGPSEAMLISFSPFFFATLNTHL